MTRIARPARRDEAGNRRDLRDRLLARPDDGELVRILSREPTRRHTRGAAGAHLPQREGLDDRFERARLAVKENQERRRTALCMRPSLRANETLLREDR